MADTKAPELFPMRLLGLGLFLAWCALIASFEQATGVAGLSSPVGRFYIGSLLTAAGYVLVAALARRGRHDMWGKGTIAVCAACAAAAPLLEWGAVCLNLYPLDLAGLLAKAAASVGLFLGWNSRIAGYRPRTAQVAYAGSLALGAALYFLVNELGEAALGACVVALPLASGALLAISPARSASPDAPGDGDAEAQAGGRVVWRIPWHLIVLVVAFSFTQQLVGHCDGRVLAAYEWGRLAVALLVCAALILAYDAFDVELLAKLCPTLLLAALVMCGLHGFDDTFGVKKLLASMGYYGFSLYMYFMLSSLCYRFEIRAEWLFGVVWAGDALAGPFGASLGNVLNAADAAGNYLLVDAVTGAAAVSLMLLTSLLLAGRTFGDAWGIKGALVRDGSEGNGDAREEAGGTPRSATSDCLRERVQRCEAVAHHFGLTHREEEVMSLMVEGRSFQEIEALLSIAHGTLRVHVQHVYAKLDVHSGDEVRAFVAGWRV